MAINALYISHKIPYKAIPLFSFNRHTCHKSKFNFLKRKIGTIVTLSLPKKGAGSLSIFVHYTHVTRILSLKKNGFTHSKYWIYQVLLDQYLLCCDPYLQFSFKFLALFFFFL